MKWLKEMLSRQAGGDGGIAEYSDIGGRDSNQDYCAHLDTAHGTLLVVADGLGGHEGGELASKFFCTRLTELAHDDPQPLNGDPEQALRQHVEAAALAMRADITAQKGELDAHTTCAVAWISKPDHRITTAHIGDSRIYIFNRNEILWRSRDHSVVQMLVDMGEVDEKDMGHHPEQGSLTRTIGMSDEIRPSIKMHGPLDSGTGVLLCSDGFWEQVSDREIQSLARGKLDKKLASLVAAALQRGGSDGDNVTAQVYYKSH